MANRRDVVRTTLTGDATLASILTGGIHDASTLDQLGLTVSDASYDANQNLLPTAVIRWRNETQLPPLQQARQVNLSIWLYEQVGWVNIEAAESRIYALLNFWVDGVRQHFSTDDGLFALEWIRSVDFDWLQDLEAPGRRVDFVGYYRRSVT